ncbi:MAG: fumarylacetoacetate hydrolase family protein, partial [Pseudomonadota bacterium]|nr:fumarylacetoacetate hydrolase family protein [Pseudomonadota bacterium]
YCVGRNYAAHAREMGDDPSRDLPFFFCKDKTCVQWVAPGEDNFIPYPQATKQLEYEVELVVALTKGGKNLTLAEADEAIWGYSVGLDMTRRDLQSQAKQKGRPWESGKAFDHSAPMSSIVPRNGEAILNQGDIALSVNGKLMQHSNLTHLTWDLAEVVVKLSEQFELRPGDLIMTGTPENVGAVQAGDIMEASVEGVGKIVVQVR